MGVEIKTPLNGESKSCTCKQSKPKNSFTTSHRQESFLPSPGTQGSIRHSKVPWHLSKHLPHSSPIFHMLKTTSYDMEHSLGQLEHSVFPPNYLCIHSLVFAGVVSENTSVLPTLFPEHAQNMTPYQLLWRKIMSISAKISTPWKSVFAGFKMQIGPCKWEPNFS